MKTLWLTNKYYMLIRTYFFSCIIDFGSSGHMVMKKISYFVLWSSFNKHSLLKLDHNVLITWFLMVKSA
ncbi:MAG: hypothetical protein ACTS8U_04345 [Arsenophonus sp. ET-DL9-MAG3]